MFRNSFAFALLALCYLVPHAHAEPPSVKKGTYNGMWQGGKMKFTIEKVSDAGKFSGVVHFDKESEWPNLKFDFTGEIGPENALTIHRVNDEWDQVVTVKVPSGKGKERAWKGTITGKGTEEKKKFELHMPE
jgi:hypothetical protein